MTIESCRCDRCSLVFQKGGITYLIGTIHGDGEPITNQGHLCPLCSEELITWIGGEQ